MSIRLRLFLTFFTLTVLPLGILGLTNLDNIQNVRDLTAVAVPSIHHQPHAIAKITPTAMIRFTLMFFSFIIITA